ncbi:MAG: MFS transporter, partial [Actinobacteria bacterium]|nr:MFS transporter [Actinomycetota bacterium]
MSTRPPARRPAPRGIAAGGSRFGRLARTHAAMAAGDAAMAVALADSVLFSLDADAARSRVLLFLGISFVPFLFVAPLIGPAIDRMAGGRRLVIQSITVVRVVLSILMAFNADSLLLFPLAFVAMVAQKTYAISKSALVPTVVRSEEELVEANSKLGLISGLVGAVAIVPAGVLQKTIGAEATLLYAAAIFGFAFVAATRLPREVIAARSAGDDEEIELHSDRVVLASTAMLLLRASAGFTFFHLFFWFRAQEAGLVWFGLSLGFASLLTMTGNAVAPLVRSKLREETMLVAALTVIAVAGFGTSLLGGVIAGMLLAGSVNFAAAIGRLAFEAVVQRDAPDANRGRAFAQFETKFQLGWVGAGLVPVVLQMPGRLGFVMVGIAAVSVAVYYVVGTRAVDSGRTVPHLFARRPARRAGTRGAGTRRPATARSGAAGRAPAVAGRPAVPPPPPAPPRGRRAPSRQRRPDPVGPAADRSLRDRAPDR